MTDPTDPAPVEARFAPAGRYRTDHALDQLAGLPEGTEVRVAGRVRLWRPQGRLCFGQLQDMSARVQFSLQADTLGDAFHDLRQSFRVGDFIGIRGRTWTTRRGEYTVDAVEVEVLNRAVQSMPDKWHGIQQKETQYRKRYLDLLYNEDSRSRFVVRTRIIAAIRRFLDERGFIEVETPVLQAAASGASARPFATHHNALGRDLYLRIAKETYLKRLVAGSLDRVYEIGKDFRNEGMDASHLQEFTMLEWYAAYWDYRDNMRTVQELVRDLVRLATGGPLQVEYQGTPLDFGQEWPELDYREEVLRATGIDLREVRDAGALRAEAARLGLVIEGGDEVSYGGLVDLLYKRTVRPGLVQPCFLIHHPAELVPLARRSDEDPTQLDMFQVVVNGWEVVKAYSELVDAGEQRHRLEEQMALRAAGDEEAMMLEEDFLEAMEYGMPPMSGLGLGIDRLVALLTDAPTLRDVVLFPQMRDEAPAAAE